MEIKRGFQCAYVAAWLAMFYQLYMIYAGTIIFPWYTLWKTVGIVMINGGWTVVLIFVASMFFITWVKNIFCE